LTSRGTSSVNVEPTDLAVERDASVEHAGQARQIASPSRRPCIRASRVVGLAEVFEDPLASSPRCDASVGDGDRDLVASACTGAYLDRPCA